jgi:hypothetical protein
VFPLTITLTNLAQLNAVMAALAGGANAVVSNNLAVEAAMADTVDPTPKAEAPGKPSAAKTARSQPTVEAAPSPTAPSDAAPAPSTEATPPAAAAPSASVAYPDLQKAVLTLHKMDPTAAVPIAKSLGADTFKLLPEAKWAEALAQVTAAIETRKAS